MSRSGSAVMALPTCTHCNGVHKVLSSRGVWDRCPVCRPSERRFDCPDCTGKVGQPCKSSSGRTLPTYHTRRTYLMQDAAAKWAP